MRWALAFFYVANFKGLSSKVKREVIKFMLMLCVRVL